MLTPNLYVDPNAAERRKAIESPQKNVSPNVKQKGGRQWVGSAGRSVRSPAEARSDWQNFHFRGLENPSTARTAAV